jgi:hypothetical protein
MILNTQTLKSRIQTAVTDLEHQVQEPEGVHSIIKIRCSIHSLTGIHQRLDRIESLLQIPKYDVVFIGKIGVGKTTAICHLFNLVLEEEKPIGKGGKTIQKSAEILSTGSGRTTIGEVVIQPSQTDGCYLEIEPYQDEQIEDFIVEACTHFWHKAHSSQADATPEIPPAELLRAIRNITDLRETTLKGRFDDAAVTLAKQHSTLDEFIDAVIKRADLAARNKIKFLPPQKFETIKEEKRWLKTAFANLNLGKAVGYSLPKKIFVCISSRILDFKRYPRVNSIIDTRGMDSPHDRADLAEYIHERDNTICLLAEQFVSVPTNVSGLLKQHLTPESRDIDTKLALLVLLHKGEAEDVMGPDGTVEDKTEGIEVRTHQISNSFLGDSIKFLEQNIFFFDALQFYDEERALKSHYDAEDVKNARTLLLDDIDQVIQQREQTLLQEVQNYEAIFEQIRAGGILSRADNDLVTNLKKKIERHQTLSPRCNFEDHYIAHLRSYHASTFRAVNGRCGIYETRGIDIYFDAKAITKRLLRERLASEKDNIAGAISLVEQQASQASGLKPVMQVLREQVDKFFEALVARVAREMAEIVEDCLAPQSDSNKFWQHVQERWGKGSGYKEDVLGHYKTQLKDCGDLLAECMQTAWTEDFMQELLAFFDEG